MNFIKSILLMICILTFSLVRANDTDKLICFSDRDVYSSGDQIRVSLFVPGESPSRIIYVDLAGFSGNHIAGVKLLVVNHRAEGFLTIPDSVRTGTYLLRSYINRDKYREYCIRDLLIANRFEDFSTGIKGQLQRLPSGKPQNSSGFVISVPDTIKRREKAQLRFTVDPDLLSQLEGGLDVSISKQIGLFQSHEKYFVQKADTLETIISERKGIIISGKVIDKVSHLPVSNATVFLSVPDSVPGFQYDITKGDGCFRFLLKDIYGKVPMVIQAVKENENKNLKLILDDKFKLNIPDFKTDIVGTNNELIEQLAVTVESFTFKKIFNDDDITLKRHPVHSYKSDLFFYGEPTSVVSPDQFYNLRDFTEISRELLSGVKLRERNGQLVLKLVDNETTMYFEDQAFVLVDGIPVQDLNIIKDLGTSKINWIHTVLENRFFGDLSFPGVVAIHTRDYNLKWLTESDRLMKIDYEALQFKEDQVQPPITRKIPDLRPVLLWETNVNSSTGMQFDFKASDIKGTFSIRVVGKKKNGELVVSEETFTVN